MSKKGKLILATALFGAALFGASCGGGGGGGATAGTGTGTGGGGGGGGGGGAPSPTEEGRVLALLNVSSASAGAIKPVAICRLMSNNRAECGSDLNPGVDVVLEYVYEFPNGNVVLKDTSNVLYFFNGSQVIRPDRYRALGGISNLNAPSGITIPTGTVTYYATSNFLIIHGTNVNNIGNNLVVVTRESNVISDNSISLSDINASCEAVTKGTTTYKLEVNGTSSSITTIPDSVLDRAGDRVLVRKGNNILLSSSECSATGVLVYNITSSVTFREAKMVKAGNDFYIAVRYRDGADEKVDYYRVSGDMLNTLQTDITLASGANEYFYALDGRGVLYAITGPNIIRAYRPTNGTEITPSATVTGVSALLPFADRVLARGSSGAFDVEARDTGVTANLRGDVTSDLNQALGRCVSTTNTIATNGVGTNLVRCVWDNGSAGGERLAVIVHNGNGNYSSRDVRINSGSSSGSLIGAQNIRFGANAVLVPTRAGATNPHVINRCSITTTPTLSVSCSPTDLPNPVSPPDIIPLADTTRIYPSTNLLKFSGNNVFYLSGSTLKVGDIFGSPVALSIPAADASGGNASFNLTRFAFSFGPAFCKNQIAYLSSPTASPKRYDLPSGNCVDRILKVY